MDAETKKVQLRVLQAARTFVIFNLSGDRFSVLYDLLNVAIDCNIDRPFDLVLDEVIARAKGE